MISEPIFLIAILILIYGLFSGPLAKSIISAPMVFMLAGLALGPGLLGLVHINVDNELLEVFAEFTLGLILFADATATDAHKLFRRYGLPQRLLLLGLPLSIGLGALIANLIFPQLGWAEAALIAALLAPTDAALGYAVISNPNVPERIRQGILVESGLNDGLALPAVLFFAAFAFSATGDATHGISYWITFAGQQIFVGVLTGIIIGWGAGKLFSIADNKGWVSHNFKNLTVIGVAIIALLIPEALGGNAFISTFIAGLMFGHQQKLGKTDVSTFTEEEGQLFSLIIFFFFGAVLLPDAFPYFTIFCVTYALLSLTIIRIVPALISMLGTDIPNGSRFFVAWFGPRGLASILFLLIAVGHIGEDIRLREVESIVYITVFLSVILHGVTAVPFANLYKKNN